MARPFHRLLEFLPRQCSPPERLNYSDAAERTVTGRIRVQADQIEGDGDETKESVLTLANIQVVTGERQPTIAPPANAVQCNCR